MTPRGFRKAHMTEYRVWDGMISRCERPNHRSYPRYGGRGISICRRWRESFVAFVEDMGPRPSLQHSIDRIDNDGNYEPGNCRWATASEQQLNRRCNNMLTYNGTTKPLLVWAREMGIDRSTLRYRIAVLGLRRAMALGSRKLPRGGRSHGYATSSTGYKGVYKTGNRFVAMVSARVNGKQQSFPAGRFDTAEEAALAYNAKAREVFGDFARLNPV